MELNAMETTPRMIRKTIVQREIKKKAILRAAVYSRVSTGKEIQEGSFETQNEYFMQKILNDPGMELVDIYGDFARTGRNTRHRDEFNRLIKDCVQGKIDIVFVKNISRFARNFVDCMETLALLKAHQVRVIFDENGIDTGSMQGELVLGILAAIAQEESNSIAANLQWAHDERAKRGTPMTVVPYGYRRKSKQTEWTIVEDEADCIRQIYQCAASGYRIADIVRMLNESGGSCEKQKVWTRGIVRHILTNIAYIGDYLSHTRIRIGHKEKRNEGEKDQYYLENHHPAIVSRELFDAVQQLLEKNKKHHQKADAA